jgi:hypothetical protein
MALYKCSRSVDEARLRKTHVVKGIITIRVRKIFPKCVIAGNDSYYRNLKKCFNILTVMSNIEI